jgi:hypothetical protein
MKATIPYATATAGAQALNELQKTLAKFGCSSFGTMTDVERGVTIVQFRWRNRAVSLEASWKGYAQAFLKSGGYTPGRDRKRDEKALEQAKVSVCSALRDWVKGQITAVECGVMSFEAAFMPHMLLPTGERVLDRVQSDRLLAPPDDGKVVEFGK